MTCANVAAGPAPSAGPADWTLERMSGKRPDASPGVEAGSPTPRLPGRRRAGNAEVFLDARVGRHGGRTGGLRRGRAASAAAGEQPGSGTHARVARRCAV